MIKDNVIKVRERIAHSCERAGCDPAAITIVAAVKGRTPEQIQEALDAGITDVGENKVQEALVNYKQLRAKWHMIGHLQTNKAKDAVEFFDLIHSVDSLRLAGEIDRRSARANKIQDVLIEVKTSDEASKFGIEPENSISLIKEISGFRNIRIRGLMTVAPIVENPQNARPYFRMLRELKDRANELRAAGCELNVLSMGMTADFEVAVEEGANMVRLGRVIFGG
ncbi:MAG: YggS family pyridoxal phosphate-dependent enzyme [Deltaproteobacteria bacterium]